MNFEQKNSMKDIPLAACGRCGGWHSQGGMSQHSGSLKPIHGRTGCQCPQNSYNVRMAQQKKD